MKFYGANRLTFSLAVLGIAAACVFLPPDAEAQRLGRLFSTSEERALLDELRRERQIVAPDPQSSVENVPDDTTLDQVTINGMVLRSSGVNSAWINGRQVNGGTRTREGVRVDTSSAKGGRVKITLPSGAETVDLKPGQKIDVDSGVVVEGYERASSTSAYSVFDRVSADPEQAPDSGAVTTPPENDPDHRQAKPTGTGRVQYPEALVERIRRALQGN